MIWLARRARRRGGMDSSRGGRGDAEGWIARAEDAENAEGWMARAEGAERAIDDARMQNA